MRLLKILFLIVCSSFLLIACGTGGGGGNGGGDDGSDPALLVGTWDLTVDKDGNAVLPGTVTVVITDTTYATTTPDCEETGTYTADRKTIKGTVVTVKDLIVGGCDATPGDINEVTYTVNSTTLTITDSGGTNKFERL